MYHSTVTLNTGKTGFSRSLSQDSEFCRTFQEEANILSVGQKGEKDTQKTACCQRWMRNAKDEMQPRCRVSPAFHRSIGKGQREPSLCKIPLSIFDKR